MIGVDSHRGELGHLHHDPTACAVSASQRRVRPPPRLFARRRPHSRGAGSPPAARGAARCEPDGISPLRTPEARPTAAFRGWDLVRVPPGEDSASNCVLDNDRIFFAEGSPRLASALRELGHLLIVLPMSVFQKMDGGLSCLSLRF